MSKSYRSNLVDLDVHLHVETAKAILISLDGVQDNATWLPKSLCEIERKSMSKLVITLNESVAVDKGLI